MDEKFQRVPHGGNDQLEAYDAEVKRPLVKNDVAVLVLFCCALY